VRRPLRYCLAGAAGQDGGRVEFEKHLLVDGYNIVHAWPDLRRVLDEEGRDVARARLVERVRVLHDHDRWRVSVVFDGRGAAIAIERPTPHTTFSVIYSPAGMTADDVIEQLVGQAPQPGEITVATGDLAERNTVEALGAQALSPGQLEEWSVRSGRAQSAALADHGRSVEARWRRGGEGSA